MERHQSPGINQGIIDAVGSEPVLPVLGSLSLLGLKLIDMNLDGSAEDVQNEY